jgi:signal transduction histidine kinase
LRIRGKLALLVIIPLLAVVALTVPVVMERIDRAGRAADTADAVRVAGRVGALIQDIQLERMLSVGFLVQAVDAAKVAEQGKVVTDHVARLIREAAGDDPDAELPRSVVAAITGLEKMAPLRAGVLAGITSPNKLVTEYNLAITALVNALALEPKVDVATPVGKQVVALDAALRSDELVTAGAAYLVIAAATKKPEALVPYFTNLAVLTATVARFTLFATPPQRVLYTQVQTEVQRGLGGTEFTAAVDVNPLEQLAAVPLSTLYPALQAVVGPGKVVSDRIAADVIEQATDQERRALIAAYLVAGLALLVLLLVAGLSAAVARAVVRPLTRLTRSADRVARVTEGELTRVADDEAESPGEIRLDPVDVRARDEVGDLARAFERVQGTAISLVERQVASRRNVAQMFGHVGRRTQNLVGRQIQLIDRLEEEETDADRLQHLYRLDHVSSRLRRNAGSLVVLSGAAGANEHDHPLPLSDVVRLALAEIEDYTRVDVAAPVELALAPAVINDVVLVLAELMENATVFSPPHTRVTVTAGMAQYGVQVAVTDHGIGMPDEQIEQENARLERRERLDLAPTGVLGLFVVGRVARRHGLRVLLGPTPGGGVTATVDIPDQLLARWAAPVSALQLQPTRPAGPAEAVAPPIPPTQVEYRTVPEFEVPTDVLPMADGQYWPDDPANFDVAAVSKASRTVATGTSWSAFVPRQRTERLELPVAGRPAEGLAGMGPADRPTTILPAVSTEAARTLVQDFDAGVRRALSETQTLPVVGAARPAAPQTAAPQTAVSPLAAPRPAALPPAAAGMAAPVDAPDAGHAPLTRRRPGATLEGQPEPPRPGGASAQPPDPDEARRLVEQYEAGVIRALGEVRANHQPEEGST